MSDTRKKLELSNKYYQKKINEIKVKIELEKLKQKNIFLKSEFKKLKNVYKDLLDDNKDEEFSETERESESESESENEQEEQPKEQPSEYISNDEQDNYRANRFFG